MPDEVRSVAHALRILRLFDEAASWGVTDAARELGLSTSTTHRLLQTLAAEGFVKQLASKRYELGVGISLSSPSSTLARCLRASDQFLRLLRDSTDETVHMAVLTGLTIRYVAALESSRMMKVTSRLGEESPAHATAVGKILLSYYTDAEIRRAYRNRVFETPTPLAVRDLDDLLRQVQQGRKCGYARNVSESEEGMYSIAVPVLGPRGKPVCGLSLSGPLARIDPATDSSLSGVEMNLKDELLHYAEQISRSISSRNSGNDVAESAYALD